MRRSMLTTVLAASATMALWCGSAQAQGVEVYVGPRGYDYYDYPAYRGYYYAPPASGYSYRRGGYYAPPENYRYGSRRWWRQMDRNSRGGH